MVLDTDPAIAAIMHHIETGPMGILGRLRAASLVTPEVDEIWNIHRGSNQAPY